MEFVQNLVTLFNEAYEKYEKDFEVNLEDEIDLVLNGGQYAFYVDKNQILQGDESVRCSLQMAFESGKDFTSFAVPKNSEFYPVFRKFVNKLKLSG